MKTTFLKSLLCLTLISLIACMADSAPVDPLDRLEDAATGPTATERNGRGRIAHVSTRVHVAGATSAQRADAFIAEFGTVLVDDIDRLQQREVQDDDTGDGAVVIYDVLQEGRPVYGAEVRVAVDGDGNVRYAGGNVPDSFDDLGPATVDEDRARIVVRGEYPRTFFRGGATLVVFNPGLFMGTRTPSHLAWMFEVLGRGVDGSKRVFVDAHTGLLIVGIARNHTERQREVFSYDGVDFSDPEVGWTSSVQQYNESGVLMGVMPTADATAVFGHAGSVYDFYSDSFGRDSLDDAGLTLRFRMDLPEALMGGANAYWDGTESVMVYTPGLAVLDITAHELTHGVVEHTAGLEYWMEAGAINESMADTFAAYIDGGSPWTIGDGSSLGVIRSFSDPLAFDNPHHVSLQYKPPVRGSCADGCDITFERCVGGQCMLNDGFSDAGGVHINSSIPNHIVYLFTEGGTHEVSGISIAGIGRERSMHVVYEALRRYLGVSSTFLDYRAAARQAIVDFRTGADWAPEGVDYTYEHCGAILNAFSSAGVGAEDHDNDCFDDEADNCPCVFNPEQKPEDCDSDADTMCLDDECMTDGDCMAEGESCGPAGRCVTFTAPVWDCNGPGECPAGEHCWAGHECADPCASRTCDGCVLDTRCEWCEADGACMADIGACSDATVAPSCTASCSDATDCGTCSADSACGWCDATGTCEDAASACMGGHATTCPGDCDGAGSDMCLGCNEQIGCGWCEGTGCMADREEASCGGTWLGSLSTCAPCEHTDCNSCASDGFCSWCPGMGCFRDGDARMMCASPAINPSSC